MFSALQTFMGGALIEPVTLAQTNYPQSGNTHWSSGAVAFSRAFVDEIPTSAHDSACDGGGEIRHAEC